MDKDFELARICFRDFNPNVLITWEKNRKDRFVIFDREKNIYAKIYQRKNKWFIYYTTLGYRVQVASFTDAINIIEKEVERSWMLQSN